MRFGAAVTASLRDGGRVTGIVGLDGDGRVAHHPGPVRGRRRRAQRDRRRAVGASIDPVGAGIERLPLRLRPTLALDGYHWVFRPGARAGVIPTNDGLTCVFVGAGAGASAAPGPPGASAAPLVRASLAVAGRRARPVERHGRLRRFAGRPGYLRRPWGPGWALVGDAGYCKDPITAHGMTDALRDAELTARAVLAAASPRRTRPRPSPPSTPRNRLSIPLFDRVDAIAGLRLDATRRSVTCCSASARR